MLKQAERLSKRETDWLIRKGEKFNNEFFSIKFRLNKKAFCRYSMVVSKKMLSLATDRNHLRRQYYEILRQMPRPPGNYDFLIFVKARALKLSFDQAQLMLPQTINKISSTLQPNHGL